jgi:decaprenyl-phosphate phosphoribosyltransferase
VKSGGGAPPITYAPPVRTRELLTALRPRQWAKNLLVLAAPLAAGRLLEPEILVPTLEALLAFCLASSAVYLVNDVQDREADALHPTKSRRPIASGRITPTTAYVAAGVLAVLALGCAALGSWSLVGLLAGYLLIQVLYSVRLKHEPVLDLVVITIGFLMRAVAGGVASGLPISQWFLMVAGFGSLFVVAGKRYSELHALGAGAATRRSLVRYTDSYLRFVWSMAAAACLMSYSLWAFDEGRADDIPWHALSIAPLLTGLLRYAVDIDCGKAGEPEDIIWGDRVLQAIGVAWIALVLLGVAGA